MNTLMAFLPLFLHVGVSKYVLFISLLPHEQETLKLCTDGALH